MRNWIASTNSLSVVRPSAQNRAVVFTHWRTFVAPSDSDAAVCTMMTLSLMRNWIAFTNSASEVTPDVQNPAVVFIHAGSTMASLGGSTSISSCSESVLVTFGTTFSGARP